MTCDMKLFEVLNKAIPKEEWSIQRGNFAGTEATIYTFNVTPTDQVMVQFAAMNNIEDYFYLMERTGLISDHESLRDSFSENAPNIPLDQPIVNMGFGVNMSPEQRHFEDRSLAYIVLATVTQIVLDYNETSPTSRYIFGTENTKKLSTFKRMLSKYTSNITDITNLPDSNGYDFLYVQQ